MKKLNAVILARGGSKSIPKKNLANLNGTPLIGWVINAAKQCKDISQIYVSTDDKEISSVSQDFGALVIERPAEICMDESTDLDAFRHIAPKISSQEGIIHLRATTPTIEANELSKAINLFFTNPQCTSLRSAHETPESAYKFFKKNGPYWQGISDSLSGEYYNLPRQDLPCTYHPNGYIDILKPKIFMNKNTLHGDKILSFITKSVIEIDNQENLDILRVIVKNNFENIKKQS